MPTFLEDANKALLAGWTLGSTRKGRHDYQKLVGYSPLPTKMEPGAPLDSWLVWSKHLIQELPPELLGQSLAEGITLSEEESVYGQSNLRKNILSPASGSLLNPLPSGSEAIIRCLYWGLAFWGNPALAARYSYFDASIDHAGDGVWIPVALATSLAQTKPNSQPSDFLDTFLKLLPSESKFYRCLPLMQSSIENIDGARELKTHLASQSKIKQADHVALSAATILFSLNKAKSASHACLIAAGFGASSHQTTAATAVIGSIIHGQLENEWFEPLGNNYVSGSWLRKLDPPQHVDDFITACSQNFPHQDEIDKFLIPHIEITEEQPVTEQPTELQATESEEPIAQEVAVPVVDSPSDERSEESEEQPTESIQESAEIQELEVETTPITSDLLKEELEFAKTESQVLFNQSQLFTSMQVGNLMVQLNYHSNPWQIPGVANQCELVFINRGQEPLDLEPEMTIPEGWEVASKLGDCRILAGESQSFPCIIRTNSPTGNLVLKVLGDELIIPFLPSQEWAVVAPFVNDESIGWDKEYGPEKKLDQDDRFNGRSNLAIRWEAKHFPGIQFDLEPLFGSGPGVAYLAGKVKFSKSGLYRMLICVPTGVKVWVDGERIYHAHDYHEAIPRLEPRYMAEFTTSGESEILIKVVRGKEPLGTCTFAFFNELGVLVTPLEVHHF